MSGKPDQRRSVQWGHLALLVIIGLISISYLLDARATSLKINNLLLVQPAVLLALGFIALILPQIFPKRSASELDDKDTRRQKHLEIARVAVLAAAFGGFVFSLETIGFDAATFLFVAAGLYICGERRYWVIAAYSAVFTVLVVYGYQQLVPYPFPMLLL